MPLIFNPFTGSLQFTNSSGGGSGITTVEGNSGSGSPISGVFDFIGSGGVNVSVSGNVATITTSPSGTSFTDESSDFTASSDNGYFCTATLTATLPPSPTQGNVIIIIPDVSYPAQITIQAPSGHFIRLGASISSSGGTAISNAQGDALTLYFREATSTWISSSSEGTWSLS